MQQFREVSRTRTIYSTETHTSDFILNTFWNGKPVQFFQERCCVVMTGCQENKSCSKVLNFLGRLDDRIRCTHKETVAVVKPWKDVGSNKNLGCVFSEKPADWTNAFKLEISSLADFYDVLLHGQFWVKNESKVPGRIREGDVVRAKSNRVREGTGRRFQGRRKGKEKSFCFVVVQFELIFRHPCFYVVCDLSRLVNGKVSRLLTRLILSLDPTLIPSEWSGVECTALEYTPVNGPAV